jgi:hypothetical protein
LVLRIFLAFAFLAMISFGATGPGAAQPASWHTAVDQTTVFSGDWINVTLTTNDLRSAPLLFFNLTDPNGTVIDEKWLFVDANGTVAYWYRLPLEAPPGKYLFTAVENGSTVAQVGFTVQFDELNYLSKIVSLQGAKIEKLEGRVAAQQLALHDQDSKLWWYWLIPVQIAFFWFFFTWILFVYILPATRLQITWDFPISSRLSKSMRLMVHAVGRFGPSDQRNWHPRVRLFNFPGEADPSVRAMRRAYGLSQERLPRETQIPRREPAERKLRPVRRGTAK